MSDLFHENVSIIMLYEIFLEMLKYKIHEYIILTKRAKRMYNYLLYANLQNNLNHIWFGVSVSNQKDADELIPILLECPVNNKFVSIEPMLEKINISRYLPKLKWVIVGAESGAKKRYCDMDWISDIVNNCSKYKVPVFVKQIHMFETMEHAYDNKFLLEKNIDEFPKHLQVQEYPGALIIKNLK
jgi:protein gp37